MDDWTGRCLCGRVRFRLATEPFDCGWCHCRKCQLASGSPAMVFASVPRADYFVTQGETAISLSQSTSFGRRAFCGECGTPLYMQVDYQPDTADFSVATLDEPGRIRPGFHIFWASRVPWLQIDDGLPKFDRFRPNTVGVEGTEPPA